MRAQTFWKAVVSDRSDFLERLIALLEERDVRWCLIGGQAVNAYVEPLVSLDLDIVVTVDQPSLAEDMLRDQFAVERLLNSLDLSQPGGDLRVQVQLDPRYGAFVERASIRDVLGYALPVAAVEDVMQGKIWAATDSAGRPSKRRKDLLDIERLVEAYPLLRSHVPAEILGQFD